jgi:hypothetical protein
VTVTPDLIAVALGRPTISESDEAQWSLWIADALMLIEARLGDPAELDQTKLDYVVREAVIAHIRRPDDVTQVTQSVDGQSLSKTYRTGRGRVTILDEWWDLLSPPTTGKAFEIDTMPADAGVGSVGTDYWWSTPTTTVEL